MTETDRQLKAIMFSDVKSFSAMMAADEERTMRLIKEHRLIIREILARYDGEEHGTAGDSFFVLFSSAVKAVSCAVEIQETFHKRNADQPDEEQIWIRIGIHIGDIIVDASDNHVYGEGINIAARTEPKAEPGGICITQDVFKQVKNKIDLKVISIGRQEMKNIVDAPELYKIIVGQLGGDDPISSSVPNASAPSDHAPRSRTPLLLALALIAAAGVAAFLLLRPTGDAPGPDGKAVVKPIRVPDSKTVLVVLPFENVTGNAADDWLGIGFAEQVQSKLTAVEGVSVLPYRNLKSAGDKRAATGAAREAGVTTLVTGSFQKVGDQIRITAHAENSSDGSVLGEAIEQRGAMPAIFDLQDAVAVALAEKLRGDVGEQTRTEIKREGTRNLEAFEAYSKGVALLSVGKVLEAMSQFDEAIAADPKYKTARASTREIRMSAEEVAFLPDGQSVITRVMELEREPDTEVYDFKPVGNINIQRVWDFTGKQLEFAKAQISENEWSHEIRVPLPEDAKEPFGIVLEDHNPSVRGHQSEGLWAVRYSFTYSGFEDRTFVIRLPREAILLSMLPTPASASVEQMGQLMLLRQSRRPGLNLYWGAVYTTDPDVAKRFMAMSVEERSSWIEQTGADILPGRSRSLAMMAESSQACLAALQGRSDAVGEMLEKIEESGAQISPAARAHALACQARLAGDESVVFEHLEVAVRAKDRPWELIQELYFQIVDVAAETGALATAERLVRGELKNRGWWNEELFHNKLSSGEEEVALRKLLGEDSRNTAARRDLALVLHRAGRHADAAALILESERWSENIYLAALFARVQLARNDNDAADAYRSLIRLYPLSGGWVTHAQMLVQAGRAAEALTALAQGVGDRWMQSVEVALLIEVVRSLANPVDHLTAIRGLIDQCPVIDYSAAFKLRSLAHLTKAASESRSSQRNALLEALLSDLRKMAENVQLEINGCDETCLAGYHDQIAEALATDAYPDLKLLDSARAHAQHAVSTTERKNDRYLDTLAEVFERLGDLENAAKINEEGLTLAPDEQVFLDRKKRLAEGKPHGAEPDQRSL